MSSIRTSLIRTGNQLYVALLAGWARLDKSFSPRDTIQRLQKHAFSYSDLAYVFHILLATFWITIMGVPGFPLKLGIPLFYGLLLLIPFTCQFFLPFHPIASWILTFYSSRFIPTAYRPSISVSVLPTLETVLYGANISDILTRFTHPILDVFAWIPYGVAHFTLPFFVGAFLWLFRPSPVVRLWARTFGYMNLLGVIIQILFPCAAPWYEVIFGLTPADYSMLGSPGGLLRIDHLLHGSGYTVTFSNAPVVFGAFPSLHAGCATLEALFLSHFFPQTTKFVWGYASVLYWATMYLTHHYLIDVVGGACLAIAAFYVFLPDEYRGPGALAPAQGLPTNGYQYVNGGSQRSKYEIYDLEAPRTRGLGIGGGGRGNSSMITDAADFDLASDVSSPSDDEGDVGIAYRSPAIPSTPQSSVPLMGGHSGAHAGKGKGQNGSAVGGGQPRRSHKHTASIASLIRADERTEEGWSPIATGGFVIPPTPTRAEREAGSGRS
ncbi:PAP2-domain-containing protein [Stereum hirsutum FP-91666 SS1]|uniref:PAP2-domain-containing protein n=1 Tax=Stereum hirsutum (strain FP-91666) TaxID=721885 RepID=UPI000444A300|nr:PAP2-domain-containing protein [Stereum hirsutum FP-91666 SS1]EIM84820.1 PAP2-domain-containing protein [Stereum hirsutum FP-91666 SS1]